MLFAGFIPSSFVDWHGKVVGTVFTYGCNFRCPFCHNYTLVTEKQRDFISSEKIIDIIESLKHWIDGVCITGGEPTIHSDLIEFIKEIRRLLPIKIDTNGTDPEMLLELTKLVDYIAMDIKAPWEKYRELTGSNVNIKQIKESIHIIMTRARDYEFRTTAVPVLTIEDFIKISKEISQAKRYVIQQYSTARGVLNPSFLKLRPLSPEKLSRICTAVKNNLSRCVVVNL